MCICLCEVDGKGEKECVSLEDSICSHVKGILLQGVAWRDDEMQTIDTNHGNSTISRELTGGYIIHVRVLQEETAVIN